VYAGRFRWHIDALLRGNLVCPHLSLSAPFVGTNSVVMAASSKIRDGMYFSWLNHDAEL